MGVEILVPDSTSISMENGGEDKIVFPQERENGKVVQEVKPNDEQPIQFGSHGSEEPVKVEIKNISEANLRKDALAEWPAPERIIPFYFVKYRPHEDQSLKAKLDYADKELQSKNKARSQIIEKLKEKRADRAEVIAKIRTLISENKQFRSIMDEKRKELKPLQQALGKLRDSNFGGRERGPGICSSEEELNSIIKSLEYRIQHESIPLSEEKQLLREIKELEGSREKVVANAAMRAKLQDSLGEKEVIQDQVKLMGVDLDGVRKDQQVVKGKLNQLDEEKAAIEKDISLLQEELSVVMEKRDKTYEGILELRKKREVGNVDFYQNRMILNKAREIATKKDIQALEEFSKSELEKFMSLWNTSSAARDDYKKRIISSFDFRQLSEDGRMRNPNEKPLLSKVEKTPPKADASKNNVKPQPKEDPISIPRNDTESVQKVAKEKKSKNQKEAENIVVESAVELEEAKEITVVETTPPKKGPPPMEVEINEAKLKEMKREEEIAKAKQAAERKKKLAEKAAAKAAARAQREAEKKIKEREKRAKKKAGTTTAVSEPEEPPTETAAAEPETPHADESVEPPRDTARKEKTVRYKNRTKDLDNLPRITLKRKKSTNYWAYAAVPGALLILIVLAIGYNYLS